MRHRPEIDKAQISININTFRKALGNTALPMEDLRKGLKEYGLSNNPIFIRELVKADVLSKYSNLYRFTAPGKPVNKNVIYNVYKAFYARVDAYSKKCYDKRKQEKAELQNKIDDAVVFLKGLGYELYAPAGTLYVKLLLNFISVRIVIIIDLKQDIRLQKLT